MVSREYFTSGENSRSGAVIFEEWPEHDLETLGRCPYCGNTGRSIAHSDTRDWFFSVAPGNWVYWTCNNCGTLYLDPRPTSDTIGRAYSKYYTHAAGDNPHSPVRFMQRLRNECLYRMYRIDQGPRLERHPHFAGFLYPLRGIYSEVFPIPQLAAMRRGSLLDVGCGNGDLMRKCRSMGYEVSGLENDELAARLARRQGLNVMTGSFEQLLTGAGYSFDYVVCSHVIEHVHDPLGLIQVLVKATGPGGTIFLSLPNADSLLRKIFGKYWRGLEPPRHLALPSASALVNAFTEAGNIDDITIFPSPFYTLGGSMQMRNGGAGMLTRTANKILVSVTGSFPLSHGQDMLQMRIRKGKQTS